MPSRAAENRGIGSGWTCCRVECEGRCGAVPGYRPNRFPHGSAMEMPVVTLRVIALASQRQRAVPDDPNAPVRVIALIGTSRGALRPEHTGCHAKRRITLGQGDPLERRRSDVLRTS